MARFKRSVEVPYSPKQMYELVDNIEAYPDFLPWCESTRIDQREDDKVEATIGFQQVGFRGEFTTRNELRPYSLVRMELLNGPFDVLTGSWQFDEMRAGAKVTLRLHYRFDNALAGFMFATVVETIADELIHAFAHRAEAVYQCG